MPAKKVTIEEGKLDTTGLVNVDIPVEVKEGLYKGIAAICQLMANMDKGCTYAGMTRDYITAMAHFKNFEKGTGIQLEAPKKK
ncbi:MAG TPA: hypothetical protein PK566_00245 [Pseudobacteroides sp.]|nr:hypothetical protein [Pseudobacteroides sp.]